MPRWDRTVVRDRGRRDLSSPGWLIAVTLRGVVAHRRPSHAHALVRVDASRPGTFAPMSCATVDPYPGQAGDGSSSPTRSDRSIKAPLVDAAVTLLIAGTVVVPVWPGIHTIDSQAMLSSAQQHRISNWYAPLHAWAWGVTDRLGVPPGLVLLLTVVAFTVALLATFRLWLGRRAAFAATAATVLWPPVYGMMGWVGRDVWYAAEIVGVVAALGWATRYPQHRTWLFIVAAVLAMAAADARQNGFILCLGVAGFAAWQTFEGSARRRSIVAIGAAGVGGLFGIVAIRGLQASVVAHHYFPSNRCTTTTCSACRWRPEPCSSRKLSFPRRTSMRSSNAGT